MKPGKRGNGDVEIRPGAQSPCIERYAKLSARGLADQNISPAAARAKAISTGRCVAASAWMKPTRLRQRPSDASLTRPIRRHGRAHMALPKDRLTMRRPQIRLDPRRLRITVANRTHPMRSRVHSSFRFPIWYGHGGAGRRSRQQRLPPDRTYVFPESNKWPFLQCVFKTRGRRFHCFFGSLSA